MSWANEWCELYSFVSQAGKLRNTRAGLTRELIGFNRAFLHPHFQVVPGRGGSEEFALIEQLSYIAGADSGVLASNFPGFRKYQEKDGRWPGAYGPRLAQPLIDVVQELSRHPDSRRGVAAIWRGDDAYLMHDPVDVPCTIALNFWRNDGFLNCHAFMRSTDVWKGIYYDVPAFYAIQCVIAEALQDDPGPLWFTTTSLHLYQQHLNVDVRSLNAGPKLKLPTELFEGLKEAGETAVGRLAMIVWRANNYLQTFYKLDAPLG